MISLKKSVILVLVEKTYKGEIKARIVELRFASAGKLRILNKKRGDLVKKGELAGSLDKKLLQAELDKQLGDYEKARAEFEIFNLEKGEPKDDIAKYLKSEKQSQLNISVKEVELAKARLDQADLFFPFEGIVIGDSDLVPGLNITPASSPITVLDTLSYYFVFDISQQEISDFQTARKVEIKFEGLDKTYLGNTLPIFPSKDGRLQVEVKLDDLSGLLFGLSGQLKLVL